LSSVRGIQAVEPDDLGTPDSTINGANFGKVKTQANLPRQMQLGVRLEF
jgi:hypothetical protein